MLSEPRAVYFQTELEWLPFELSEFRVKREVVRQLYNKLFEPEFSEYHYENLELETHTPTLSKHTDAHRSICQFGEHSVTIEERQPDFAVDRFIDVVKHVLNGMKAVADDLDDCRFPPFCVQRCRIQCLAQPNHVENSLELLAAKVARVNEAIDPFERPPSFFGVRFRFPPAILVSEESKENEQRHEDFVTVRFETYSDDVSQIWMEAAATYILMDAPVELGQLERINRNIHESYSFLTEKCKAFLDQFDSPSNQADPDESPRE